MKQPSLRFHLRDRTWTAHQSVDDAVGPFDSLDSYRRYLSGTYAFRKPLEAALVEGLPEDFLGGWKFQPLLPLIEADMADLGVPAPEPVEFPVSGRPLRPEEAAGWLYVLEGSSLGARLLDVRARALGLSATHGARHLATQAAGGPSFRAFAERLDAAPLDADAVVDAALAAFAAVGRAFGVTPPAAAA